MSVVIYGVDIPDERDWIDVRVFRNGTAIVTGERAQREECEAVFLKPHGRLIDAEALCERLEKAMEVKPYLEGAFHAAISFALTAPTVIEVEEAGE